MAERTEQSNQGPGHDLVIRDVRVLDGRAGPPRSASICVDGARISEIRESTAPVHGRQVIEGRGLVAAPGFVDAHVHSDVDLLWNRQHAASLLQGVTTHVLGQDGLSYAPLSPDNLRRYRPYLAPINGDPAISWDWSSVGDFRRRFDGSVALNTAYLVPHGTVRFEASGMHPAPLVGSQLDAMCSLVEEAFEQGAAGLSTGLSYFPGSYADTEELVALCHLARKYERPYVTHLRTVFPGDRFDPMDEALEIARRTGVSLHISHYRTTVATVGRADEVMAKLDAAHEEGIEVSFDMYPYLYGSGPLYIALPPWAFEGGLDATLDRLADPRQRPALVRGIESNVITIEGAFTHVPHHPEYVGRSLPDVAAERGCSVADLVCDLLLEEKLEVMFHQGTPEIMADRARLEQFERDVFELLDRPYAMVGSDGVFLGRVPHERGFSSFPRLLRMAREHRFPLEKLVNRCSTVAAERFGLTDRGALEPGMAADVVLFDPATVRETSTPDRPRRGPEGVPVVIVNGQVVVDEGNVTGLLAGRALAPGEGA